MAGQEPQSLFQERPGLNVEMATRPWVRAVESPRGLGRSRGTRALGSRQDPGCPEELGGIVRSRL